MQLKVVNKIKLNFEINQEYKELDVLIRKNVLDNEVQEIINKLSKEQGEQRLLIGHKEKEVFPIEGQNIFRLFTNDNKTFAVTKEGIYTIRYRLYELEEILDSDMFLRISNSEVLNMTKVKKFDLGFTGTIKVFLKNGDETYVSRRYVVKVKKFLGL